MESCKTPECSELSLTVIDLLQLAQARERVLRKKIEIYTAALLEIAKHYWETNNCDCGDLGYSVANQALDRGGKI